MRLLALMARTIVNENMLIVAPSAEDLGWNEEVCKVGKR